MLSESVLSFHLSSHPPPPYPSIRSFCTLGCPGTSWLSPSPNTTDTLFRFNLLSSVTYTTLLRTVLESSCFLMSFVQPISRFCGFHLQLSPLQSWCYEASVFLTWTTALVSPLVSLHSPPIVSTEARENLQGCESEGAKAFL